MAPENLHWHMLQQTYANHDAKHLAIIFRRVPSRDKYKVTKTPIEDANGVSTGLVSSIVKD